MTRGEAEDLINLQPIGTFFVWRRHILRKITPRRGFEPGRWERISEFGKGDIVTDYPIIKSMVDKKSPWSFS